MQLPVNSPVLPMLAKRVDAIPESGDWLFEPKWDGFRCLVFRDAEDILLQSRDTKPLNRYFPDLIAPLLAALPSKCVLDGEIVISHHGRLDFDALQLRIHPAASRVKMLAAQTPASIVFFDLLCKDNRNFMEKPFTERREQLERLLANASSPLHITPATQDSATAQDWFRRFEGAGLDGVIAKKLDGAYQPGKRVLLKIKHERDCDCVVAGFRWHKNLENEAVGSLLLGLYDDAGALQHVGVCASFPMAKRKELVKFLEPCRKNAMENHPWAAEADGPAEQRIPGAQSRWSQGKDLSWVALRPELVLEVAYEHMQGTRFRHMAQFRRWRTDKPPHACTYEQLEVVPPHEIQQIFSRK